MMSLIRWDKVRNFSKFGFECSILADSFLFRYLIISFLLLSLRQRSAEEIPAENSIISFLVTALLRNATQGVPYYSRCLALNSYAGKVAALFYNSSCSFRVPSYYIQKVPELPNVKNYTFSTTFPSDLNMHFSLTKPLTLDKG